MFEVRSRFTGLTLTVVTALGDTTKPAAMGSPMLTAVMAAQVLMALENLVRAQRAPPQMSNGSHDDSSSKKTHTCDVVVHELMSSYSVFEMLSRPFQTWEGGEAKRKESFR